MRWSALTDSNHTWSPRIAGWLEQTLLLESVPKPSRHGLECWHGDPGCSSRESSRQLFLKRSPGKKTGRNGPSPARAGMVRRWRQPHPASPSSEVQRTRAGGGCSLAMGRASDPSRLFGRRKSSVKNVMQTLRNYDPMCNANSYLAGAIASPQGQNSGGKSNSAQTQRNRLHASR